MRRTEAGCSWIDLHDGLNTHRSRGHGHARASSPHAHVKAHIVRYRYYYYYIIIYNVYNRVLYTVLGSLAVLTITVPEM